MEKYIKSIEKQIKIFIEENGIEELIDILNEKEIPIFSINEIDIVDEMIDIVSEEVLNLCIMILKITNELDKNWEFIYDKELKKNIIIDELQTTEDRKKISNIIYLCVDEIGIDLINLKNMIINNTIELLKNSKKVDSLSYFIIIQEKIN